MLLVSGLIDHPSFKNVAEDIIEIARARNIQTVWGPDYLNQRRRNYMLRPIVIGSLISTELHFYVSIFHSHPTKRLAYLTAEGPLDMRWWKPEMFEKYVVVVNSHWTAKWLHDANIRVDRVVHHAYNPDIVSKAKENRQTVPGDSDTVWFSYIGQVGPRKRPELMLQAFRTAQRKTGYKIGLITNAKIDQLLDSTDSKIVRVGDFGSMERYKALAIVAGSQYYLHLSRSEGFGLPALEARALGVPLVALEMQPTTEFIPSDAALWVPVKGVERVDGWGLMAFMEHTYDIDEAADIIVQAHDLYTNHRDDYEELAQHCLDGVKRYAHTSLYPSLLQILGFQNG